MSVQINVAANQAALTASIQAGVQAYNQRFAQNNQLNLTINPRAFSQPLGRITGDVKDFEAALAASNARVIAFGASTAVLGGVIRSFKELANVTIEVEKNLADINRVFGLTTSQLQKFSTDLFNVTKQTASSFNDASQAALEFSRQGLKAEETLQRTKDALTLTRLAGVSTANAVDALTSTVNGFAATGVTTTQILNKLVAVEQDFAVGAGDLAEALSRTGQAAQEAGVSLDQLNALVTSAQQSTARGGAVIGNALKTIFTRLQRTDTLDQLEAFNISVRDVQGNILPAVTILQNFAGAYQNLADAQRAQLSEQVAGVYQVNILKAIVNDLNKSQGVYAGALQRGAMATNEAEVATAKLNQTLDALLKQTATSTQQLANNIGKVTFEPLARYGTEQLKSLVESMNEILEGEGIGSTFANGLLKGIRNILAGPGAIAAFFTLFKLIQNSFTYLTQALPQIAGITTETQNRKNIEQSILQIMAQQGPVAQALAGTMGNQAAQAQLLLQVARQQTAEYQTQTALARQLAAQLAGQGVRVRGSGGLQVTRAGGYIPASTKLAEVVGAQAGGYSPGRVVPSPVGGVMNTAEDVKYIPGFAQPFINPPARSKAGRAHRQNAINRTGVDPYMFSGFIPNFVKKSPSQFSVGRAFEQSVGFDIKVPPSRNKPIDFKEVLEKPINKNFNPKLYQSNTFADAHSGLGHTSAENISKVINHIGQNYYAYSPKQGSKTKRLKIDDKTSIISQPDLLGDLFIRPRYTEIIGEGSDVPKQIETSSISSLNTTAKKTLLNGVSQLDFDRILRKKIKMQFAQDRVYGSGFIPNFAIPVDSARIPWFKKYASSYKNTASDKDVFRQIDFPTYGKGLDHNYAKVGNADMVSFLYEDFVRSAINIALGSKQVVRSKEAGFKHTPTNAISNRDPIDLTQKISNAKLRMIEVKQSKNNQKETISQISDAKLKGLFQENPELAKNVELMSIIFNDPRYVDPTGKNPAGVLSPFEQSIAPIVKNSYADVDPTMRGKLGLLTDGLMKRYQSKKNLFSKGFIPNFADLDTGARSMLVNSGTIPFVVDLERRRIAESSAADDIFHSEIVNKKFIDPKTKKPIYPKLYKDDIHSAFWKDTFVRGFVDSGTGKVHFDLTTPQKEDKNFIQKYSVLLEQVRNKYAKKFEEAINEIKSTPQRNQQKLSPYQQSIKQLGSGPYPVNHFNNGFIPNFNFIKGRNSFQKNWLIETAKKRNLNLNDPNTFSKLATEFAKTYPNDQGMFGLNKGFIPNFAYKQAVMGLEESMSGNKAIFDTKPFPHIRNSSQPTFSSAISDHGGLGNALSDSMRGQKAAGLMSRGFVPNFAPRPYRYSGRGSVVDPSSGISQYSAGLGFSLADQERRAKDEFNRIINSLRTGAMTAQQATTAFATLNTQAGLSAKAQASLTRILNREVAAAGAGAGGAGGAGGSRFSRFSRGLSRAGTAISIAGPTIAGFAEQSFFGDRKRSEMSSNERMAQSFASTGLSAVTTGVGIGAQAAGLPGALIGGAVGGLIALKSALDSASLSIDELKEKKEEEKNKIIENISSAERYLAIQEEISKSTSPKDIKKNLISLRAELSSIKDADFANKIKVAGTDINSLSAIVQEYSLKQKEATSVLNDAILVQKKYSFETLKSAGILKIQKEGGTGALAQTKKFLSGGVNAVAQFFGIGGTKETELGKLDFADKRTRETVYKENPNLFKSLSKIDPNILVDIGNVFAGEVTSTMGFGGFATKELEDLLKKGGLKGTELDETVAVLKEAGDSSNYLGNTLADAFVNVVSGFSKYSKDLKKEEILMISAAEAVANLNQQLKDFINNLDYSFKDLSRQNEFEKNLRGVRQANTMLISESLYGKRDALQTQLDFDIEDVRSGTRTKELDISKKLLTTNIQDYYNLSDAQKTAYLQLSKSFDLSKPEENLKKIEGFIQTQFGTLDTTKAIDKQKDYLTIISNVRKDIAQTEKESADDLAIAAEKFKEALMAMELSRDFVFQFKAGFRDLATEGDQLIGTIGRQLPKMFADGLVDGIKAAIRESDNLGEALMGIASKFLDEISTMMMRSGIYQIVGAFAPSILQSSVGLGAITPAGKQKGGLIRAQSGMYVSGTGSGDKYPALLENGEYVLNRNAVMAMGGPAALDTLNFSAAPRFASGGSFNAELSDIKAMEEGMTTFGLENSSLYKQLRDAEIQRAEQERQKKRARQAQTAQMVGSLVAAVATIGIGAGISNKMGNVQAGKAQNLSAKLQTGQPLTNAESLSIRGFMNKGLISTSGVYKGPEIVRSGFSGFTGYGRQTGGLIGSRLSDTIPGYMEGGLYNSTMVKKYGTGMQAGGMSPVANNNSNTVNNNNANNAFNFNTTVNRDGTIQMGANSTSYKQQDVELSNNLNNRIYGAVLDVIRDQQRFGGSLAGTRKA